MCLRSDNLQGGRRIPPLAIQARLCYRLRCLQVRGGWDRVLVPRNPHVYHLGSYLLHDMVRGRLVHLLFFAVRISSGPVREAYVV